MGIIRERRKKRNTENSVIGISSVSVENTGFCILKNSKKLLKKLLHIFLRCYILQRLV